MSSLYEKRPLQANENVIGMVLQGAQGCADLVAIYNMVTLKYSVDYGQDGPVTEKCLKSIVRERIPRVRNISAARAREAKRVLSNIRTDFSLQPRLSGHMDFVPNASYLLCHALDLTVLHGWVLNPEVSSYDSLNGFSHQELLKHTRDQQGQSDRAVCEGLLDDFKDQLTSYGFNSLPAQLTDDAILLFFCRNRLNIIHKHCDVVYMYVTDEDIRKQMPEAIWMLFEECQERKMYFTEQYTPVKGQPCEKEAMEWHTRFLPSLMKDESQMEDETRMKNKKAARNKIKKEKRKLRKSSQQGQSHDVAPES